MMSDDVILEEKGENFALLRPRFLLGKRGWKASCRCRARQGWNIFRWFLNGTAGIIANASGARIPRRLRQHLATCGACRFSQRFVTALGEECHN
jgi:hypothetical protein